MKGWLQNALAHSTAPKESVIGALKKNLGGQQPGRDRAQVHASDITKSDFCPRREAFYDQQQKMAAPKWVTVSLDVTFQNGTALETLVVEEWGTGSVVGNWQCRYCGDERTMVKKPNGCCKDGRKHWWRYVQFRVDSVDIDVSGGLDSIFDLGAPLMVIAEVKSLAAEEFDKIVAPLPEHRQRTNLYMQLIEESHSPYKEKFNVTEARVLYISRGHGRANPQWNNEILPFKEFVVKRDPGSIHSQVQKAKALKLFREGKGMPSGICDTALDKYAKGCSCCTECFSGDYPAAVQWHTL